MDWTIKITNAVDFLEENLSAKPDIVEAAKIADMSLCHFQRSFQMICGMTLNEYLRRRRLNKSLLDIQNGCKVIDAAYKYGYETPEAFAKAFKKFYGINPLSVRKPETLLKAFPKIKFNISIEGGAAIDYKLQKKNSFKIVGKNKRVSFKNGANFIEVSDFWQQSITEGWHEVLFYVSKRPLSMLGISYDFDFKTEKFTYMIAVENNTNLSKEYDYMEIPEAKWAVFESKNTDIPEIKNLWKRIFSEWFPLTGYEHDLKPEIEVFNYSKGYINNNYQIWIPIKDK